MTKLYTIALKIVYIGYSEHVHPITCLGIQSVFQNYVAHVHSKIKNKYQIWIFIILLDVTKYG